MTQGIVYLAILQLKDLHNGVSELPSAQETEKAKTAAESVSKPDDNDASKEKKPLAEKWSLQDKEKLFIFLSKLFLMNFPLYQVSYKRPLLVDKKMQ